MVTVLGVFLLVTPSKIREQYLVSELCPLLCVLEAKKVILTRDKRSNQLKVSLHSYFLLYRAWLARLIRARLPRPTLPKLRTLKPILIIQKHSNRLTLLVTQSLLRMYICTYCIELNSYGKLHRILLNIGLTRVRESFSKV